MLKLIAALALVAALGVGTFALAGAGDGNGKPEQNEKHARDAREGQGPPPWAPAHGWRCKDAGNTPGSEAFKDCVKAKEKD